MAHLRIAIGSDTEHAAPPAIADALRSVGHEVHECCEAATAPWPEVGAMVAGRVAGGDADYGIACCWTGTGVSIAANKVAGVRAALCTSPKVARDARRWNDANVLALGLADLTAEQAIEIARAFLEDVAVDPSESENIARLNRLDSETRE